MIQQEKYKSLTTLFFLQKETEPLICVKIMPVPVCL